METEHPLPLLDLANLHHHHHNSSPSTRLKLISDIGDACRKHGFFQVINHGISTGVMEDALASAAGFFSLPENEKTALMSEDVSKPIRYDDSSLNKVNEEVLYSRKFLKHYANPLSDWLHLWPSNPPDYKEKMGRYVKEVRKLALDLMEAIFESLGLKPTYLEQELEDGSHAIAVSSYPACTRPEPALGLPAHSDYGFLTILLQNVQGLQVLDGEEEWRSVPALPGALVVHVGDHLEMVSNGVYKSVVHRVTLNPEQTRLSVASLSTVGIERKVGPAPELVDEQHPKAYGESSFGDFLHFLASNEISGGRRFLDTVKIKP